jgi:hypothetical protein
MSVLEPFDINQLAGAGIISPRSDLDKIRLAQMGNLYDLIDGLQVQDTLTRSSLTDV